jgi:pimeloyl-ACP methyl ester carboxylesterase
MTPELIEADNCKIAYIEKNKNSQRLIFFIHGNSGSSQMWMKQFDAGSLSDYRLIAIDLPGHGYSSFSDNPSEDYSPTGTAILLSKAIREIAGSHPFLLIGFSYGTNVIAEMLNAGLKPNGIVLIGSSVMGEDYGMEKVFAKTDTPSILFYNETDNEIIKEWLTSQLILATEEDVQNLMNAYLKVSPDFKPALFKSADDGKITDEILALKKLNVPVCTIFGNEDKFININYLDNLPFAVWRNKIYKLPGAGHWVNIDQPRTVDQIIAEYAMEMFTSRPCLTA